MSFDRLAPHYTWMERVLAGGRLQRARTAWLETLAGRRDILIAGVGHGHFLRRCALRFPEARITSVDASAGMLRRARQHALRSGADRRSLHFVHAELPAWQPASGGYDAIVSHFFLDCFPPDELACVIATLARAARPEARWLIADFALPPGGLARHRARAVHALMYRFFRQVTRIPARSWTSPDRLLAEHGFTLAHRMSSEWGLLQSDCWRRQSAVSIQRSVIGDKL